MENTRNIFILQASTDLTYEGGQVSKLSGSSMSNSEVLTLNGPSTTFSPPYLLQTNDASLLQTVPWTTYDHMNLSSDGQSLVMDYSFDNKNSVQVFAQNQAPFSLEDWSNYDTLSAQVYGDGSGNELEFWYRMNNIETKGWEIGSCKMDWTGWKEVTLTFPNALRNQVHRFVSVVNWDNNKSPEGLGSHQIEIKDIELSRENPSEANTTIHILKDAQYKIAVNALSSSDSKMMKIKIGNSEFTLDMNSGDGLEWIYSEPMFLTKGDYTLSILPDGKVTIDTIMIYSTNSDETLTDIFQTNNNPATVTSWNAVNATKYEVHVNAQAPFTLAFAEAHDQFWVAKINGKEYKSLPLYSVINGFYIDKTGNLTIDIEYKPQLWFYYGIGISGGTCLLVVSTYIVWILKRKRQQNPINN